MLCLHGLKHSKTDLVARHTRAAYRSLNHRDYIPCDMAAVFSSQLSNPIFLDKRFPQLADVSTTIELRIKYCGHGGACSGEERGGRSLGILSPCENHAITSVIQVSPGVARQKMAVAHKVRRIQGMREQRSES